MKADDNVFRALNPNMAFEKPDGSISAAAFKDKNGFSVEIDDGREESDVINSMLSYLDGNIVKISVSVCEANDVEIYNDYSPNKYHRLLLDKLRIDDDHYSLRQKQCKALAKECRKLTIT